MLKFVQSSIVLVALVALPFTSVQGDVKDKIIDSAVNMVITHCEFDTTGKCGTFDSLECGWPFAGNNLCQSSIWAHPCELGESVWCDFREKWCEGRCSISKKTCYSATRTYCN